MVLTVNGLLNADLLVNAVVAGEQECWLLNADLLDDFVVKLVVEIEQVEEYVFLLDNTLEVEGSCLMIRVRCKQ